MDWFKSSLQAAQKQAQDAAEKAKALAQQASQQALVFAGQASEQAKVFAGQASEQAKVFAEQASGQAKVLAEQASSKAKVLAAAAAEEAQAKLHKLATATAQASSTSRSADTDAAELAKYGVTPGLLETISGMTYSTFSDYPLELLPTTNPLGFTQPIPPVGFRLSPWQERHALLVLSRGDQLQGLRFALCPKRMNEEMFWVIYFTLVKTLLPPEAFAAPCPPSEAPSNSVEAPGLPLSSGGINLPARVPASAAEPSPAAAGSRRGLGAAASPGVSAPAAADAAAAAAMSRVSADGGSALMSDGVLVGVGSSASDSADGGDDDSDGPDGGDGADGELDALENDPELAAYLQEALDVAEGGDGEGLSDLGSATDDLDDYINQLDAELGTEGGGSGEGEEGSPSKPGKSA